MFAAAAAVVAVADAAVGTGVDDFAKLATESSWTMNHIPLQTTLLSLGRHKSSPPLFWSQYLWQIRWSS